MRVCMHPEEIHTHKYIYIHTHRSECQDWDTTHGHMSEAFSAERDAGWLRACSKILSKLRKSVNAGPFLIPVDPEGMGLPDYLQVRVYVCLNACMYAGGCVCMLKCVRVHVIIFLYAS